MLLFTDRLNMTIADDWDVKPQTLEKPHQSYLKINFLVCKYFRIKTKVQFLVYTFL